MRVQRQIATNSRVIENESSSGIDRGSTRIRGRIWDVASMYLKSIEFRLSDVGNVSANHPLKEHPLMKMVNRHGVKARHSARGEEVIYRTITAPCVYVWSRLLDEVAFYLSTFRFDEYLQNFKYGPGRQMTDTICHVA
jgi:hypothetical protein